MNDIFEEPYGQYDENRDITSLICWKDARIVKLFFYQKILPLLPGEEKFNFDIQIRKASVSITANISEGYGRFHYQEGLQFYRISRGSLYELKDHLISCHDLKYIEEDLYNQGLQIIEKAKISLNGFINFVKSKNEKLLLNMIYYQNLYPLSQKQYTSTPPYPLYPYTIIPLYP